MEDYAYLFQGKQLDMVTSVSGVILLYKILQLYPGIVRFPASLRSAEPHIRFLAGCDGLDSG